MSQIKKGHRVRQILGAHVKAERERQKRSQEEVAEAANLSQQFLSEIENGKRSTGIDAVGRLADALRVKIAKLFTED